MTTSQAELLTLLGNVLFGKPTAATVTTEILSEARIQTVSALISDDYSVIRTNIRVIDAHAKISALFTDIPFTTFKGYASAYYYPEPVKRSMGDVDFITATDFCETATERLLADGWKKSYSEHERHEAFKKGNVELELHHEIKGIPNGIDGIKTDSDATEKKVRSFLSDLIETAKTVETQQGPIRIPDDFHHGIIMLLHIAGHIINNGGIGLRHLCDWAVYVANVRVEDFRDKLESVGLWTFACQLTAVSSQYLGLPKQDWAGDWSDDFLKELIEDVLSAGNFGRREAGRSATMALERTSFAAMTRKRYPQARNALLLPIFSLVNLARFGCLLITGKRKPIKLSTMASAKKRNALYRRFKLFESE